jgi:hypothetical protein
MIAKNEKTKMIVLSSFLAKCSAHDTGIQTRRRFSQEAVRMDLILFKAVGAGPTFFFGVKWLVVILLRLKPPWRELSVLKPLVLRLRELLSAMVTAAWEVVPLVASAFEDMARSLGLK